jgi:hypothetical protein
MPFAQVEEMVAVVFVATEAEPEVRQATQNGLLREGGGGWSSAVLDMQDETEHQ